MKTWITGLAALLVVGLAGAGTALAQQEPQGFNAQNFKPPVDPFGFGVVNGARTLDQFQIHLAAYGNWAKDPLEFTTGAQVPGGREIIEEVVMADFVAAIGLLKLGKFGGVQLGVGVPYTLDYDGLRVENLANREQTKENQIGDLRPELKVTALDREDDIVGVAVRVFLELPTGREEDFLSNEEAVSGAGTLILEKKLGPIRFGVEVGWQYLEQEVRIGGLTVDDKILLGAGVAIEPIPGLGVYGEVHGWGRAEKLFDQSEESPFEAGAGIRYQGKIFALVGVSGGLNEGVGAPDARIALALGLTF